MLIAKRESIHFGNAHQRLHGQALLVLSAYFLAGRTGLAVPYLDPGVTLLWLPSGIALAALLHWGWPMLFPVALAAFALNLSIGLTALQAFPIACGNTLAVALSASILQYLPFHRDFSRRLDIVCLAVAAMAGMLLSATTGSIVLWHVHSDVHMLWLCWWIGDSLGILLCAPLLLNIQHLPLLWSKFPTREIFAYTALFLLLNWLIFMSPLSHFPMYFLIVPVVLWTALRFGAFGSAAMTLVTSLIAAWATSRGYGPFILHPAYFGLLLLWGYTTTLVIATMVVSAMQTQHDLAVHDLRNSLANMNKIASRLPGLILQYRIHPNHRSSVPYISDGVQQMFELQPSAAYADPGVLFVHVDPGDLRANLPSLRRATVTLSPWQTEFRLRRSDGSVRWLYIDALPEREPDGTTLWHCFVSDITERKQAQQELLIAAYTFEAQEGIMVTDADWRVLRVNKAFTRISGFSAQELVGERPPTYESAEQDAAFFAGIFAELRNKGYWHGELWSPRKNGELYPQRLTLTALQDGTGAVTNYIATFTDNSRNKDYEEEIRNLAFYDSLTQLPNRRLLMDRLQHLISVSNRHQNFNAILFIDLDNFKTLNDTRGHDAGDVLLVETAARLRTCVRDSDTVARLGGDEFVVVLEKLSEEQADAVQQVDMIGEKIRQALSQPYQIMGSDHHGSCSIGICLFQGSEVTVKDLFKRADTAMYEAKTSGRNAARFFDPAMQAVLVVRMMLENNLRQAVAQAQFKLYYQVQVNADGTLIGAEALLRWYHPDRGYIPPAEFIPLAEETGMILPIGLWVLQTACAQIKSWEKRPETAHLTLAVNVSAKQFQQLDFVNVVRDIIQHSGIDPTRLKIELTESAVLVNVEDTTSKMLALKEIGIGFAMDDFGTGYSSLAYLQRLPLTQLKIDRSFVRDLHTDENDAAIVRTIISLGVHLGLHVIAEGVETDAQRNFLIQHQCLAFQGYLFSQPLPLEGFEALLARDRLRLA